MLSIGNFWAASWVVLAVKGDSHEIRHFHRRPRSPCRNSCHRAQETTYPRYGYSQATHYPSAYSYPTGYGYYQSAPSNPQNYGYRSSAYEYRNYNGIHPGPETYP